MHYAIRWFKCKLKPPKKQNTYNTLVHLCRRDKIPQFLNVQPKNLYLSPTFWQKNWIYLQEHQILQFPNKFLNLLPKKNSEQIYKHNYTKILYKNDNKFYIYL